MKSLYSCLAMTILIAAPVLAQDQGGGDHQPPGSDQIIARMKDKLNLTPDQVNAVTPIIERYASKREELHQNMEDGTVDPSSTHSQMKKLMIDERQELSQVLSSQQLSQWKQMQPRRHHGGPGSPDNSSSSSGSGNTEGGGNEVAN